MEASVTGAAIPVQVWLETDVLALPPATKGEIELRVGDTWLPGHTKTGRMDRDLP